MKIMNTANWMDYMDRLEAAEYKAMIEAKYPKIKEENPKKEDKEKVTVKEEA